MASNYFAKGLKRSALTVALGLCFVGGVQAQSNTAGSVIGQATAGDTITVTNPSTGFSRTVTVGSDGTYRFSSLPTGQYQVSRNGGAARTVNVNVGTSANVDFVSASGDTATLDTVTVVGTGSVNPIDVSSVESTTILTKEMIDSLPVARNVTNVALLAPGTTAGDSDFGNLASFGGASVAENAYYINGFNVTNFRTGLGFSNVPFDMYQEFQIKTGGYGAEFGRSTGGVVNAVTKRGSNDWKFGGSIVWQPDTGETGPDVYWKSATTPDGDPRDPLIRSFRSKDTFESKQANIYASGPIIRDRLFFYAIAQLRDVNSENFGATTMETESSDDPFYGLKLDWNITDNHILEYTGFKDQRETISEIFTYDFNTDTLDPVGSGEAFEKRGGENHVLKYTGYFTDNFTLSALAGIGKQNQTSGGAADACPAIYDGRTGALVALGCWNEAAFTVESGEDERRAYRIDGEWQLGSHLLRFGVDREETTSQSTLQYSGGIYYRYYNVPASGVVAGFGPVPAGTAFLTRVQDYEVGGSFKTFSNAFYLEDNWKVTDNLLLNLGIRNEAFDNRNGQNVSFINIKDQWAPRLGFSWDVKGDSTMKVFGNAGRYFLPIPSNTNIRLAGGEFFTRAWYATSGLNADGTPQLGSQIGTTAVLSDGMPKPAGQIVNKDIKPMYQDEYILGAQFQVSENWSVGVRAISRDLKSSIEDVVLDHALNKYAVANGYAAPGETPFYDDDGSHGLDYILTNPGFDISMDYDIDGDGDLDPITLTAEQLEYPLASRSYQALEFFWERSFANNWFFQGSYTFSKSKGNSEGFTRSDNDQDDSGITTQFDAPPFVQGAYGYLPNDRRHRLKMFGAWQITDEFRIGSNLLIESGRPQNCFGFYPGSDYPTTGFYGTDAFYCNGRLVPRGTAGRNPWTTTVDANLEYRPTFADKKLALKLDVFNLLNRQGVTQIDEYGETGTGSPSDGYKMPLSFQSPRALRVTLSYDW